MTHLPVVGRRAIPFSFLPSPLRADTKIKKEEEVAPEK